MSVLRTVGVIWCLFVSYAFCSTNVHSKTRPGSCTGNLGHPLILTPLIQQGKIREAQTLSEVKHPELRNIKSYSGFLTVDELYNSNLFFWFFPSRSNYPNAPVLLWLEGGPGVSSLFAIFTMSGPVQITEQGLKPNKYDWTKDHSVIFIDNPVGTGYSFTNKGYAQNETIIGEHLYKALLQFFQLFPDLQQNDFHIIGQSYAGKFVPAVSYAIHKHNPSARQKINLQGLLLGNAFVNPDQQARYADYLYQLGLIDFNDRDKMKKLEDEGHRLIREQQWVQAVEVFDTIVGSPSLLTNATGFVSTFNILVANDTSKGVEQTVKFLLREDVKAAIHVGNATFNTNTTELELNLLPDILQSVAPWVSELLGHYRVLFYSGQLDIIVNYPTTVNFLRNLDFKGADLYKTAVRHQWKVDNEIAGYVKQADKLTEVLVRNAGHVVPYDQPRWTLDLLTRFTHKRPLW